MILSQRQQRGRKLTTYKHRGYAFDGAAGNDKLITDKIMNRLQTAIHTQLIEGPQIFSTSMLKQNSSIDFGLTNNIMRKVSTVTNSRVTRKTS